MTVSAKKLYSVELDGISLVSSDYHLFKDDLLLIHGNFESVFYRAVEVSDTEIIRARILKYAEPLDIDDDRKSVEYQFDGKSVRFLNRISKNQSILIDDNMYVVDYILKNDDKLELSLNKVYHKPLHAIYRVYESGNGVVNAFYDWGQALGYIMKERSKGRKVHF